MKAVTSLGPVTRNAELSPRRDCQSAAILIPMSGATSYCMYSPSASNLSGVGKATLLVPGTGELQGPDGSRHSSSSTGQLAWAAPGFSTVPAGASPSMSFPPHWGSPVFIVPGKVSALATATAHSLETMPTLAGPGSMQGRLKTTMSFRSPPITIKQNISMMHHSRVVYVGPSKMRRRLQPRTKMGSPSNESVIFC